jgi:hypothetical protein
MRSFKLRFANPASSVPSPASSGIRRIVFVSLLGAALAVACSDEAEETRVPDDGPTGLAPARPVSASAVPSDGGRDATVVRPRPDASDDDAGGEDDAGSDAAETDAAPDGDTPDGDTPDGGTSPLDAQADAPVSDAATDAAIDPNAAIPGRRIRDNALPVTPVPAKGQCFTDSHCRTRDCRADVPGGTCGLCTDREALCATGFARCRVDACVKTCEGSQDCLSGMACVDGICGARGCRTDADCPSFTECRSLSNNPQSPRSCYRIRCPNGDECTVGTTCRTTSRGRLCVEDHLEF